MMKKITILLLTALLLSTSATAGIYVDPHPERNMDDVMSLGVVYINHNRAADGEAGQPPTQQSEAHAAKD
ncbi:hypothetical protein [Pseudescherichia sp.]|uniref:hypothetical protein n=1 Tax=Pseudescherichia sp. TaxID=2055881 RepID=UPI0028A8670A|nr:hypothetical protein [Pseudescherichia sp.]